MKTEHNINKTKITLLCIIFINLPTFIHFNYYFIDLPML